MKDGAQTEIALGDAKDVFGLCELDVPLPELRRILLSAVGAQEIAAMG